nr:30S ribosomal protein S1 [Desulfuromonas sp. TF]
MDLNAISAREEDRVMDNDRDEERDENTEESFAEMFEKSYVGGGKLEQGQKVKAVILKIGAEWVFLDVGQKGEGVLDRKELLDPDGNLSVAEGNTISAYFLSRAGGELRFTTRIGGSAGNAQLEEAWRSGIPVDGHVEKEIKGGYEVKVAGVRAFCPFSQMGLRRTEAPEQHIGQHLPFRITQYSEGGRNIVVSHRALLEEERARQREALRETLQEGMTVKGTISSIRDFGAFVDIGGVEGLIPISEIAWGRVENIREVLSEGQEVEVAVKSVDWDQNRFSFSLRETLADPWAEAERNFPEGSVHTGTVARLAPFGAFVTLEAGVDGLVHISKLGGGKRISHPREVVKEGERLEVRVESFDRETRRISLAPAEAVRAKEEEAKTMDDFRRQAAAELPKGLGTLGDLLKAGMEKKSKKKKKR